ncbi:MAG: hypothetical protein AB7H80_04515 [Candidatus Kapaibacterium sp.]
MSLFGSSPMIDGASSEELFHRRDKAFCEENTLSNSVYRIDIRFSCYHRRSIPDYRIIPHFRTFPT